MKEIIDRQEQPQSKTVTAEHLLWIAGLLLLPALMLSEDNGNITFTTFLFGIGTVAIWMGVYGFIVYIIAVKVFKKSKGIVRYLKLTTYLIVALTGNNLAHKTTKAETSNTEARKSIYDACIAKFKQTIVPDSAAREICDCVTNKALNSQVELKADSVLPYITQCTQEYANKH